MKLSVIVPVYNAERYLADALDSLLNIDFPYPYEILIVNDGSTDGSRAVAEAYRDRTDRIRLLNIKNAGVSNARNVGLKQAAGEYVSFADADDAVDRDFFRIAVRELDAGGYDFVQGSFRIVTEGKQELVGHKGGELVLSEKDQMLRRFFGPDKRIYNTVWGKVFRADCARAAAFDTSIRVAEDQKYVFDILSSAKTVKLLTAPAYDYYIRSASAMRSLDRNRAADILKVLNYCEEKTESEFIRDLIRAEKTDILLYIYNDSLLSGADGKSTYDEISRLKASRHALSAKTAVKLFLLRRCRRLYELLLRRSRS